MQKIIIIRSVIGALSGYFVLHPIIHTISVFHFHTGQLPPTNHYHKIFEAFSVPMLPWSLSFMIYISNSGIFFDRTRPTLDERAD